MNLERFVDELGESYACVGRPPLEGRIVAVLLATEDPLSTGELARRLGVSKTALLKVVTPMVERGDVKRWEDPSSRQHFFDLVDHSYVQTLRVYLDNSLRVNRALQALLEGRPDLSVKVRARLGHQLGIGEELNRCLEAILLPVERGQVEELREHREDWDALPPKKPRHKARQPKR